MGQSSSLPPKLLFVVLNLFLFVRVGAGRIGKERDRSGVVILVLRGEGVDLRVVMAVYIVLQCFPLELSF